MFERLEWRELAVFLFIFAFFWCLGWAFQGLARLMRTVPRSENSSKNSFDEDIDAKWYWRLLLGYPPTNGKVAIRPAVLQILAVLMIVVGLVSALLVAPHRFRTLTPVLYIVYWVLVILILAFLNSD